MTQRPVGDVAVIIPAYNAERFVAETVASVLAQTRAVRQVVVVDDGSTDGTADVVARYHDSVELVRLDNGGVARARNRGVAAVETKWVAFLDADDLWQPTWVESMLATAERSSGVALVYCGLVTTDERLQPLQRRGIPAVHEALRNTLLLEPPVVSVSQGALIDRVAFLSAGGFDERLSTSADTDLFVRLAVAHRIAACAEDLVLYRQHGTQMSAGVDAMVRDMTVCYGKAFGTGMLPGDLDRLERRARANLHLAVGGELLRRGRAAPAVRHLLAAAHRDPVRVASVVARRLRGAGR